MQNQLSTTLSPTALRESLLARPDRDALEDEHRAWVRALKGDNIAELIGLGISWFAVMIYQMVGIAGIQLRPGGRWEPDPEGPPSYVTPVRVEQFDSLLAAEPWETARSGELVDLVAWHPETPLRWATRHGHTWLGAVALDPFPAIIRASPLAWLQADCDGFLPLTHDPVELRYLLGLCEAGTVVEELWVADELRRHMLQPVANIPQITVRGG